MKSILAVILFLGAAVLFVACNGGTMKKTKGGMPYKIFSGNGTVKTTDGSYLKINFTQSIKASGKDSVYFTSRGKLPVYFPVTSGNPATYEITELWMGLRKGDSIIATQLMDTFIKRNPASVPPHFRNGDVITTVVHVLDVFKNDSLARADEQKERDKFLEGELSFMAKYLGNKKIQSVKTPSGAFVEIINPGQGNLIDSGKLVSVNYTGTSFSGVVFDSNTDTAFHHVEPMTFAVSTGQMIKGFDEAMRFLRPGAVAKVYIPSMLAYGPSPQSPNIKPFEHLVFDIKVVDVKDNVQQPQGPVKVDVPQRK